MPLGIRTAQADATRRKLVSIGRECFMEAGFAATSIALLLERAELARGGFYHHFQGKAQLFAAVVADLEEEVVRWMSGAIYSGEGPWDQLRAACGLYLSSFTDAGMRRVLLVDGPAVLGEARAREARHTALRARVAHAFSGGPEARADSLTRLLLGALEAAALHLAEHEGEQDIWFEVHASVMQLIDGLRRGKAAGPPAPPGVDSHWEEDPWEAWRRRDTATQKS